MYQKTLTLILAFAMLFSIGYGVTGFYTLDSESLCVEESDCSYSVCCPLSGKEYGVCEQESECSQSSSGAVLSAQKAPLQENVERSYIAVSLGILLLLILAIVGYLEWKQEKKTLQRKRVKR